MSNQDLSNTVFIIDGSSFLYRAYYSIRPLTTKAGIAVNAVYGFCRMIKKIIDTYKPNYLILVWDSKGKTVRHDIYPKYKESRQTIPSDLVCQKELIQEFADSIGLKQLAVPGVEADDLMYSLAQELKQEGCKSIFITSDKDMRQSVDDYITILDPFKEAILTKESIEQAQGFGIEKLPFYYAMLGDSSDNIPGVRGIGQKGAQKLVQQFHSLEDMYQNLNKIESERTRDLLVASKDLAFLSQELFLLRFQATYLTKDSVKFSIANWLNATPFFEKLEFKSLLPVPKIGETQKEEAKKEVKVDLANKYKLIPVTTAEQLNQIVNQIIECKEFAIDTECVGLIATQAELIGLSICFSPGCAYYIPFGHKTASAQLSKSYVLSHLKKYLEDPKIKKILHHAKFDALVLKTENIELAGIAFDTMIAAGLLVDEFASKGLKNLSQKFLDEAMHSFKDLVGKNKYKDFSYVPVAIATEYAAADAHQTMALYNIFKKELQEKNLQNLFNNLEMPISEILTQMEWDGICPDNQKLDKIDLEVSKEIASLRSQILDLIGPEKADINLNSPKQLEDLLYNYLMLPATKKTSSRASFSTDQEVLKILSKIHPVPALIIKYREEFKIKTTYIDGLRESINKKTGRIHTTFNQVAVATGRLASSEPNLQNIPVDSHQIRSVFKPEQGNLFISADYSQIELRVLAYLSQDAALVKAFAENKDIHALTASKLFDVELNQVTSQMRQVGKRINFSILYGLTPFGLAKDLNISRSVAADYINKYMAQYPGVSAWMASIIEFAKAHGYVQTHWGRRRYIPGIYERNKTIYELSQRVAINTVAQGTAAEIVKLGMIALDKALKEHKLGAKMLLQIHDELILEVPECEIKQTQELVEKTLSSVVDWNIPMSVTTAVGANWQEVTK